MGEGIYSEDQKHLVKQLKAARKSLGLSQSQVAKKIGKTQSYISKIESGQSKIDIFQLKEFSLLYKRPLNFFVKK